MTFKAIHSSDLKRALMTAEAIQAQQPTKPLVIPSALFREQNFGVAEGKSYRTPRKTGVSHEEHFTPGPTEKFPGGESADDLARRAAQAIRDILLPYVWDSTQDDSESDSEYIAIASHGLFIKAAVSALVAMDSSGRPRPREPFNSLRNTGWVRVVVKVINNNTSLARSCLPLGVNVTDFDRHEHLENIIRQKGGIGSSAHDSKQKNLHHFFQPK